MSGMRVAIEARLRDPKVSGGVSQAVISLATALSGLRDCRSGEEFVFITLESAGDWLDAHVSGPCRLHKVPLNWKNRLSQTQIGPAAKAVQRVLRGLFPPPPAGIASSDGTAEGLGATLIHFPTQEGYLTSLPNIYQPHDLQHLHLPQYFPAAELAWRTLAYPAYCRKADIVLVESSWTKDDVARQYDIAAEKIVVSPFPPATRDYREPTAAEIEALKGKLRHENFIFYPANAWPHKNHLRLVEALASLKHQGVIVPLVCSGGIMPFSSEIDRAVSRLGIADQVQFLGYVSQAEIKALYWLCTAVVVPTLFESVSFPVWEAFQAAKPVACSTATSLPQQVGEAGLLFDPHDPESIAAAILSLWSAPDQRARLAQAGTARLREFSLDRMALHVRALYRQIAGAPDERDLAILRAAPLI
jgi:glycosyltransferase involved in cell wall biosynthesis